MKLLRELSTLTLLAFVPGFTVAAESSKTTQSEPLTGKVPAKSPMSGLPSPPGAHLEKIKALGDGQFLNLGAPAPDPKWGKARGRSWAQMNYAPELRAAFLYGEGRHGYTKPDGYYMDDLWSYDLNAHRWICLYPGTDTKSVSLKMDSNGFEVDETGQPIPVAQMGHQFNMSTYDTDLKKFMFVPTAIGNFNATPIGERRKAWGGFVNWPYTPQNCSPWMYSPTAGRFELLKTKGPFPGGHVEAGALLYSPGSKKLFYTPGGNTAWLYDPQSNLWSSVAPKGPRPPFGIDAGVCMDTKRDRVYLGGGYYPMAARDTNALWCFDMKTSTWIDLKPRGEPCKGCNRYGPDHAVMDYDSVNDVVVLIYHLTPTNPETEGNYNPGPESLGVYIYDPAANSWTERLQPLPKELQCTVNGFYSPELNAHVMHCAGDSEDNGTMWVYRYKQAKK